MKIQEYPGNSGKIQENPGKYKTPETHNKENPGKPRKFQEVPGNSRKIQIYPEKFRNFHENPGIFHENPGIFHEKVQDNPEISR